jgi:thymidylate kinase
MYIPMVQELSLTATLIDCFVDAFNREGLVYCHWKSNMDLAQATAGKVDLDLLVDRKSLPRAQVILAQHGFKAAVARWGAMPASIYHYYGLDPDTNQLIHVHLFSRVLTGESFVKSHLFPFEQMLLENVYDSGHIRVASKPAELVLFTLRMFVKYGSLLDLIVLRRKSEHVKTEVRWLQDGGDLSESLSLLRKYCPVIDEQLFDQCVKTLDSDSSLITRMILAQQVRRRLKVYAKHTYFKRLLAYAQLLWAEAQRRLGTKQQNKMLQAGGAVIAFVGAEATGKSTLVTETRRWLGSAFAVRTVHAGKPPTTWLTAPLSLLLPLMRTKMSSLRTNRLEGHSTSVQADPSPDKNKGLASLIYALRSVILAWERRQLLVRTRRAAANGEIVICDRYPSETIGVMDSPRLCEQPTQRGLAPAIFNWLARLEQRLYKQIPPPDIVLRLNVSVETALQRNRDRFKPGKETDAYVASRHRQTREWHKFGTTYIHNIDTEQSLAETICCVKKAIWESL